VEVNYSGASGPEAHPNRLRKNCLDGRIYEELSRGEKLLRLMGTVKSYCFPCEGAAR